MTDITLMDCIGHAPTVTVESLEGRIEYFQTEITKAESRVSPDAKALAWLQEALRVTQEDLADILEDSED